MTNLHSTVNLFQLFGEHTRVRLMALLAREELTVGELMEVTRLGQSRVSTHLGKLREAGVLRDRKAGASTFYSLNDGAMPGEARKVWSLVEDEVEDALLDADRQRCAGILRARAKETPWADAVAGQMERHYSPGRTWEALSRGLIGALRMGDVLDVGCGDGSVAALIAPRAKSIACVDQSATMIEAAQARLGRAKNARCIVGDARALPFKTASFDQVLLFNVLTHVDDPRRVLAEGARVLRRSGDLALITLDAHEHEETTAPYGHVNRGFTPAAVRKMLQRARLTVDTCEVTSREKRVPYLRVITASAHKG